MTEEPAFPFVSPEERIREDGMSLRDYFAGQALAGFLGNSKIDLDCKEADEFIAKTACEIADAMIQEREGGE